MAKRVATGHLPEQRVRESPKEEIIQPETKKEPLKLIGRYVESNGTKYAFTYDKNKKIYEFGPLKPLGQNVVFMSIKEGWIRLAMILGAMKKS